MATTKRIIRRRLQNCAQDTSEIFMAGEKVTPGIYEQIDGQRRVRFEHEDVLPATCDGHVAMYVRLARRLARY